MAKAFYSMEEVCKLLGKSLGEVKLLVQEGALREFRDAGKVFFKAEDVNKLTGGDVSVSEDSGEIMLEPATETEPEPELPTSAEGEGTSFIGLEAVDDSELVSEPTGPDVSGRPTATGIGVFDEDELEIDADPMAETQITTTTSEDQVALEGSGSGSGLLDLTREADDTSLGAELLDEIYPGEEESSVEVTAPAAEAEAEEEEAEEEPEPVVRVVETAPAVGVTVGDPAEGLFSGLMVGALVVLVMAGTVVAGMLQGFFPDYGQTLSNNFWYLLIGAVVVPILSLLVGWVIGKTGVPKRA